MYHAVHILFNGKSRGYAIYHDNKPVTVRRHLLSRRKARAVVLLLNGEV